MVAYSPGSMPKEGAEKEYKEFVRITQSGSPFKGDGVCLVKGKIEKRCLNQMEFEE